MELSQVIARLKAQRQVLKTVGGAADFDAALAGTIVLPSAFVIPLGDRSDWARHTGAHDEDDEIDFGVILAVSNARDSRGEAAQDSLVPVRAEVRQALSGWVPDESTGEPVHKTTGRLLRLDGDGRLWWIDNYRLRVFYRSQQ